EVIPLSDEPIHPFVSNLLDHLTQVEGHVVVLDTAMADARSELKARGAAATTQATHLVVMAARLRPAGLPVVAAQLVDLARVVLDEASLEAALTRAEKSGSAAASKL